MADPIKVDTHVHIYRTQHDGLRDRLGIEVWEYGHQNNVDITWIAGTENELVDSMKSSGMDHAVLLSLYVSRRYRANYIADLPTRLSERDRKRLIDAFDVRQPTEFMEHNRWICRVAQQNPALTAYINLDPTLIKPELGTRHIREMVEKERARGLKLHAPSQRFHMAGESMLPVYDICRELELPVVAHAGPDRENFGYGEPRVFAELLRRYPQVPFVLAHLGGATWRQCLELAQTYPNCFFDCCEIIEWTESEKGPSVEQLARLIKDIGTHRILMASDFPWYDLARTIDRVMDLPLLSREEKEAILGRNAVEILRLPVR
jgi:predicted TIM-barrel fold metal-dependent hydrolase